MVSIYKTIISPLSLLYGKIIEEEDIQKSRFFRNGIFNIEVILITVAGV